MYPMDRDSRVDTLQVAAAGVARSYARRIDCAGTASPRAAEARPARGGGLRDPEDWGRRLGTGR